MLTLEQMTTIANSSTLWRRRAEAMGFSFGQVEVMLHPGRFESVIIRGSFKCVCGSTEWYSFAVDTIFEMMRDMGAAVALFDPAARLAKFGSFSRKHLLSDGYTESQVDEIIRKGEEFDRAEARVPAGP